MLPEPDQLDRSGAKHNPDNWQRYNSDLIPANIREHINVVSAVAMNDAEHKLRRAHIKEICKIDPVRGVVASVMWGYPTGVVGRKSLAPAFLQAEWFAQILCRLNSSLLPALEVCRHLEKVKGIGPSTYTKMAYFADVHCEEGKCLIYDGHEKLILLAIIGEWRGREGAS